MGGVDRAQKAPHGLKSAARCHECSRDLSKPKVSKSLSGKNKIRIAGLNGYQGEGGDGRKKDGRAKMIMKISIENIRRLFI